MPLVSDNARMHWRVAHAAKQAIREWCWAIALEQRHRHQQPVATQRRGVELTLVRGPRQGPVDQANLGSYLKTTLDSLTKDRVTPKRHLLGAGWLVDDSVRWCEFHAKQEVDRNVGPAVIVRVFWPVNKPQED